ncbi:MAG: (2Fe-2S)-binding protein [Bacteroidetes bacterium]|nr:(2Fe-2S)-binding protein [Bacteroidota bacterium]MBU1373856.1 (2Fe-2S)-binding protein [Bacteroidota bacterium]MBU1483963.1 (2Fe-2S)-binding protein [Bacteroidota bacterium]MBU1761017.1 (2Fe-2S)-binding protein [Bacteroidota bacterium]MBU2046689.1 (2Fe-2S)-binding protein [Bacteroidota bacterium]
MIKLTVIDRDDTSQEIEIPEEISLNLMEVLKASEYDILATCGGMALCATCHVQVLEGLEQLPEPQDQELDMLDTLPNAASDSRLACQLRVNETLEGIKIKIRGDLV